MKNAIIVGATGFGGLGLIEILLRHPGINLAQLAARKDASRRINEVFPHLTGHCDLMIVNPEDIDYSNIDIAFFSTPDRAGMTMIDEFYKREIPVIDFSGDFRFPNIDDYKTYARNKGMEEHHHAEWALEKSVYGLPEKNSGCIKSAMIIGNPGCFAVAMILGLLPAVEHGLIESDTIVCNGTTGVSGAGKSSGDANLYPQRHENVNNYREACHQHLVEVENQLAIFSDSRPKIMFVPQVIPLNRGILVNSYAAVGENLSQEEIFSLYTEYYDKHPFVAVTGRSPNTADVRGSNRCLIRPLLDKRTGTLLVTSVIDNLIKGQAGNAVQNANLRLGFNETIAIDMVPFYP